MKTVRPSLPVETLDLTINGPTIQPSPRALRSSAAAGNSVGNEPNRSAALHISPERPSLICQRPTSGRHEHVYSRPRVSRSRGPFTYSKSDTAVANDLARRPRFCSCGETNSELVGLKAATTHGQGCASVICTAVVPWPPACPFSWEFVVRIGGERAEGRELSCGSVALIKRGMILTSGEAAEPGSSARTADQSPTTRFKIVIFRSPTDHLDSFRQLQLLPVPVGSGPRRSSSFARRIRATIRLPAPTLVRTESMDRCAPVGVVADGLVVSLDGL
jgi:hypothetical protein